VTYLLCFFAGLQKQFANKKNDVPEKSNKEASPSKQSPSKFLTCSACKCRVSRA